MNLELNSLEQLAREVLVLNALDRNPYVGGEQWDLLTATTVVDLIRRDRVEYAVRQRVLTLADTGKRELAHYRGKTVVRDGIGRCPSGEEPSSGDRAMMVYLLMNGGVMRDWSYTPEVDHRVMHLLACGVDYDQSTSVTDDVWRDSGDSFSEGDRHSGIGANVTCLCGEVKDLHVVCEVSSYVDLIKAMVS